MVTARRAGLAAGAGGVLLGLLLWLMLPAPSTVPVGPSASVAPPATSRPAVERSPRPPVPRPSAPPVVTEASPPPAPEEPPPPVDGTAWLVVDLIDPEGRPAERGRVVPMGCPGFGYAPARGMYYAEVGPCTLRAYRPDGALRARSEAVDVELREGEIAYAQLQLTAARTGGIGIRFRPTGEGMQVVHVVEGTPAWEAGLEPGDLVVSVDGTPVDAADSEAFVDAMTGAEGTDVRFEIRYADAEGDVTEEVAVTRRYLEG